MPNQPKNSNVSYLPVPSRPDAVVPVGRVPGIQPTAAIVAPTRFAKLIPKTPTSRERSVGREVAYRAVIQEGHLRLHGTAAVAIAQMHDHTHQALVAGITTMNQRVRAVADETDQMELAAITAEQKGMYVRHQLGVLEAGAYRVAAEVDRELYEERRGGLRGRMRGE